MVTHQSRSCSVEERGMAAKFVWCNDRPEGKGAAEDDQHGPHRTPHNRGSLDDKRGLRRGNGSIYRGSRIRTEDDDGGMQRDEEERTER